MKSIILLSLCSIILGFRISNSRDCSGSYVKDKEEDGYWQGRILLDVDEDVHGWTVSLQFDAPVDFIDCSLAEAHGAGTDWTLTSRGFDDDLEAGVTLGMGLIVHFSGVSPNILSIRFNDNPLCEDDGGSTTSTSDTCNDVYVKDTEEAEYWQGRVMLTVDEDVHGWNVKLQFDSPVDSIDCSLATVSGSGTLWTLYSRGFDDDLEAGVTLELGLIVHFSGVSPNIISIGFNDDSLCHDVEGSTTTTVLGDDCNDDYVVDTQTETQWQGRVRIVVPEDIHGWELKLHFNTAVDGVDCALATVSGSGSLWTLTSRGWDDELEAGVILEIGVIIHHQPQSLPPFINNMIFNEFLICSGGHAPSTSPAPYTTTTKTTSTTTTPKPTTTTKTTTTTTRPSGEVMTL